MNRKVAIGCAIFLVLIVLGVVALIKGTVSLVNKGKGWFQSAVSEYQRLDALENAWTAPTAQLEASWFPQSIRNWKLASTAMLSGVPELGLTENGAKATYNHTNGETMDVFIVDLTKGHSGDVFETVKAHLAKGTTRTVSGTNITITTSTSNRTVRLGNRAHIVANGSHARLWLVKGWLFAFRPSAARDPEQFAEDFLKKVQTARPPSVDEPLEKELAESPQ